ncbi:MAG: SPOR domain-containing protein [Gammaproteobacteria bacterium]
MKLIVFLVALANVAFFMWEQHQRSGQHVENSDLPAYADRERIILLGEQSRMQSGAAAQDSPGHAEYRNPNIESDALSISKAKSNSEEDHKAGQPGADDGPVCFEAGPFSGPDGVDVWQKQLAAMAAEVTPFEKEMQTARDYLVYYPVVDAHEQPLENLQTLRRQGYSDAWILSQGDQKGKISLGVFKQEERAQNLASQLRDKGIDAGVVPRYKKQLQRFARIKGGAQLNQGMSALDKSYPDITVTREQSCSEPLQDRQTDTARPE